MREIDIESEPLEEAAAAAADLFVTIYRGLEARRVRPAASGDAIRKTLAHTLGETGVGLMATLEEIARDVVPHSMGVPHPRYFGLVNSSPLPAAALADLVISALNNNGGAFEQSPAMSAAEEEVVRAFAARFGLPDATEGILLPGGTFANLQAVLMARHRAAPEWTREGPGPEAARLAMYVSEATHFSVTRSARVVGLGDAQVRPVPVDGRGALAPGALAAAVAEDRRQGRTPFLAVATAGTTGTGALDPLDEVAEVCAREKLWFHVDACYGGAAVLVDALKPRLAALSRADSVTVDPHKWFFVPITAAILLHRHPDLALELFDTGAMSYVPRGSGVDALRKSLPTSRRASGLAVWAALRAYGWEGVAQAVARNIVLTRRLEARLRAEGFAVLAGGELSVCCARFEPAGLDDARTDALQQAIAEDVAASGFSWFGTVRHGGRQWLRMNLVNLHTRERHIDEVAERVAAAARRLGG